METLRSFAQDIGISKEALPSGMVLEIPTWRIQFPKWHGSPLPETLRKTYTSKPLVEIDGEPLFGELAILRCLQKDGWTGYWVDTFHGGKWWNGLPDRTSPVEPSGVLKQRYHVVRVRRARPARDQPARPKGVQGRDAPGAVHLHHGMRPVIQEVGRRPSRRLAGPQPVPVVPGGEQAAIARQAVLRVIPERIPLVAGRVAVPVIRVARPLVRLVVADPAHILERRRVPRTRGGARRDAVVDEGVGVAQIPVRHFLRQLASTGTSCHTCSFTPPEQDVRCGGVQPHPVPRGVVAQVRAAPVPVELADRGGQVRVLVPQQGQEAPRVVGVLGGHPVAPPLILQPPFGVVAPGGDLAILVRQAQGSSDRFLFVAERSRKSRSPHRLAAVVGPASWLRDRVVGHGVGPVEAVCEVESCDEVGV